METSKARPPARVFTMRLREPDVEALRRLREQLQALAPYGAITTADALAIAVTSTSSALAKGQLAVPTIKRGA
jgi:hypothetical protein